MKALALLLALVLVIKCTGYAGPAFGPYDTLAECVTEDVAA